MGFFFARRGLSDVNGKLQVDYAVAWNEYRKLSRTFLLIVLGFVPCCLAVGYFSIKLLGTPLPAFVLGVLWMGAYGLYAVRFYNWPCPRCGKRFNLFWLIPTKRCHHCKLPKWSHDLGVTRETDTD